MKYPDCTVQISAADGNAFAILGTVRRALRCHLRERGDMTSQQVAAELKVFSKEATSGDYDHLLQTMMEWMNVE